MSGIRDTARTPTYSQEMANTVQDERQRLQRRLAELDEERGHIRYALDVLNRLDVRVAHTDADPDTDKTAASSRSPGTREQAVRAVVSIGRPARVEEIVALMREDGWRRAVGNATETVRAALSRAAKDGEITRTGFGLYGPLGLENPSESDGQTVVELPPSPNGVAR